MRKIMIASLLTLVLGGGLVFYLVQVTSREAWTLVSENPPALIPTAETSQTGSDSGSMQEFSNATRKNASTLADTHETCLAAARRAYIDIVYAEGMSSDLKARKRLEVFEQWVMEIAALGPEAIPLLLEQLESESDPHLRLLLLTGISRIEGEAGAEGTLQALKLIGDPTLKHVFLDRLSRSDHFQDTLVMEAVLCRSESSGDLVTMISAAVSRRHEDFYDYLPTLALESPHPLVRQTALASLERLELTFDAGMLEEIARLDTDPAVQARALKMYANTNPDGLVELARGLLNDTAPLDMQRALVSTLGGSDDTGATALLEEVATSFPEEEIRDQALIALRTREVRARREARRQKDQQTGEGDADF